MADMTGVLAAIGEITQRDYGTVLSAIYLALFALGIWRLSRFTIIPLFYPNDPKELPYWIPSKISRAVDQRMKVLIAS
jgi:hypothetical protein